MSTRGLLLRILFLLAPTPTQASQIRGGLAEAGYLGGSVRSAHGPEAGVWVIAESDGLPTKFVKIVVTDDKGRFVLPELPSAPNRVWIRDTAFRIRSA